MELPKDLIREFAASTNDQQKTKKDTTCYGTVVIQNGGDFVQIDGADTLTPAIYTVGVKNGDRVLIMLKGRKALVVGNITSPYLMVGTLEANDGIIINGYLTTNPDRTTYDSTTAAGLTISNGGIGAWQGGATTKRWYGKNDGSFYASSAEISGTITAKDGSIGGFTIGENKLHTNQHTTWDANTSGVFISPDYVALGAGGSTYLKNDGTFQFGGSNGVLFDGTKVTFGESVELNVNRIKGSKSLGDWGINFDSGTMTIGSIAATKITGTKSLGDWGINFDTGAMTIGNISASKIVSGTLTLGGNNNTSGSLRINNASGTQIGGWTNAGITAEYGTIAGWKIEPTSFSKEVTISETVNGSTVSVKYKPYIQALANPTASNTAIGVTRTVGSTTTWPFVVYYDGSLLATKANITGVLTAGSNSKIGPWNVTDTALWYGTSSAVTGANAYQNANGLYFGTSGLSLKDKFYVTAAGVPHCNGADLYINSAGSGGNSSGLIIQVNGTEYAKFRVQNIGTGLTPYVYLGSSSREMYVAGTNVVLMPSGTLELRANGTVDATGNIYAYGKLTVNGGISGTLTGNVTGHASDDLALTGGTVSGDLTVDGTFKCKNYAGSSSIPVVSAATDKHRVATLDCSTDTTGRLRIRGQWNVAGSSYSYRYIDTNQESSDIRLKENVEDCQIEALPIVNAIKIRQFDWIWDGSHQKIGVIADELEKIDSRLTIGGGYEDDGEMNVKSVNSFYLQGYVIKAIQELTSRVKELEKKLKGAA